MSRIQLTLACEQYDRTDALREGRVQPEGIDLIYLPLSPQETFWRMLRHLDFDAAEMSLAAWSVAKSRGEDRIIAIPVFTSREFRHSAIYINVDSGIAKPQDLRGKRVGVPEYMLTAVVWARGILQSEYGVAASEILGAGNELETATAPGTWSLTPSLIADSGTRRLSQEEEIRSRDSEASVKSARERATPPPPPR